MHDSMSCEQIHHPKSRSWDLENWKFFDYLCTFAMEAGNWLLLKLHHSIWILSGLIFDIYHMILYKVKVMWPWKLETSWYWTVKHEELTVSLTWG